MNANDIITHMCSLQDNAQRAHLMRFFRTAPGQYGEGDQFLGIRVPQTRAVARRYAQLPLDQLPTLLTNPYHEIRLCALLILVDSFQRHARARLVNDIDATRWRDRIVQTYLQYADYANNWDLVDLSAPKILGAWLLMPTFLGIGKNDAPADCHDYKLSVFDSLAASDCLWRQRICIVSTFTPTANGDPSYTLRYAERLLHHPHDLMHKAVGWMLREMEKRVGADLLRDFLRSHAATMPRTTLRYAIEHFDADERQHWLTYKKT